MGRELTIADAYNKIIINGSIKEGNIVKIIISTLIELQTTNENYKLLFSEADSYMIKVGSILKENYKSLSYVMHSTYNINNYAMRIKSHFKNIGELIFKIKTLAHKNRINSAGFIAMRNHI